MEEIIKQLEEKIKTLFHKENSGHDIYHLKRVLNNALTIQKKEGGDKLVIAISALLHDVHRIMQNETGTFVSPKDSLPEVKEILDTVDLTDEQKERILHVIEFHEEYDFSKEGKTVNDIETLIVQDADNLDGMGAMSVARSFSYGAVNKIPMWTPEIPFDQDVYAESKLDHSTVHHFHSKALKLKDNMNTKTAQNMAKHRHEFLKFFLKEFFDEWSGKK